MRIVISDDCALWYADEPHYTAGGSVDEVVSNDRKRLSRVDVCMMIRVDVCMMIRVDVCMMIRDSMCME